jgi:hypothetical protein
MVACRSSPLARKLTSCSRWYSLVYVWAGLHLLAISPLAETGEQITQLAFL